MKPRDHWVHPEVDDDVAALIASSAPGAPRHTVGRLANEVLGVWLHEGPPADLVPAAHAYINDFELYVLDEFDCTLLLGWRETSALIAVFAITPLNRRNNAPFIIATYRSRVEQYT